MRFLREFEVVRVLEWMLDRKKKKKNGAQNGGEKRERERTTWRGDAVVYSRRESGPVA